MTLASSTRVEQFSTLDTEESRAKFIEAFGATPNEVRKDPYRVGLLPTGAWAGFLEMPLPFAREFWLIRGEGDRIIGRIGANVSPVHPGFGYVGFFEVDLDHRNVSKVSSLLLRTASEWLRVLGVTEAYGPLTFNTWFPYRFRLPSAGQDSSPLFSWEPVNPPEYVSLWIDFGFEEVERYHSQGLSGLQEFAELTRPAFEKATAKGYSFRSFNAERVLEVEVPLLYKFSMEGFKQNFLFEPIPFEAFRQLYVPLAKKANLSLANFVLDPEGKEQGFFFCFPDQGYLVMKTTTVSEASRGLGLSNALMHVNALNALKQGCDKFIPALVRAGAQSESYGKKSSALWKHEYALFRRSL